MYDSNNSTLSIIAKKIDGKLILVLETETSRHFGFKVGDDITNKLPKGFECCVPYYIEACQFTTKHTHAF